MTRYLFQENSELIEENTKLKLELDTAHCQNRKLQDNLDMVSRQYNSLLRHHNEWLAEAKKGLDNYEFCIQDLEKENENLKKKMADCGFWKQDGTYKEDIQEIDLETL